MNSSGWCCLMDLVLACKPKGLLVQSPVRAHAWVVGQVLSWGHARGNWLMYFSHIDVSLSLFLPPFPSHNYHTVICVHESFFFFLCLIPSSFSPSPQPPPLWQLPVCSLYPWDCLHFVSLFCSLDSTYKWDHMVLVFLWLGYFT